MTRHFVDNSVRLNTGELLDINDGEGFTVECLEGAVWITQSNDPRDIVLTAGQSFTLDKAGLALVCAAAGPAEVAVALNPSESGKARLAESVPSLPDSGWARALPTPTTLVVQTD